MDISRLRFLVVDDSHMIREVIEKLLRELGAALIDKVSNGKEALACVQRAYADGRPYALVTLDWEMPVMPGLELLKLVRADPLLKELPVLMVSTKADSDHLNELRQFMPNGFLVKPFQAEAFKERVLALLHATRQG
jgi:two-component system chemotaxis response regulator CheY